MKKILILALLTIVSTSGFAAVVKSRDNDNSCTLYKVVPGDQNGRVILKTGEEIVSNKEAYGFSFVDMEINFDNREVLIQPIANIMMGFNLPLTSAKASIPATHPDFNYLINQLNRKILLFENVCITDTNEIAYAKMPEDKPEKAKKHFFKRL